MAFLELILQCLLIGTYLDEKNSKFLKGKKVLLSVNKWLKIMFFLMLAVALVGVKIRFAHLKALEMRMQVLVMCVSLPYKYFPRKSLK